MSTVSEGDRPIKMNASDEKLLVTMSVVSYLYGGILLLIGLAGVAYLIYNFQMFAYRAATDHEVVLGDVVGLFILAGIFMILIVILGWLALRAGKNFQNRRGIRLITVAWAFNLINFPVGTVIGLAIFFVVHKAALQLFFAHENRL